MSAINAEYRLLEGSIDPGRFEEWTHRVSEAYPQISPDGVAAIYHYSTENFEAINPYLRNMEPLTDSQVMVLDAKSIADMTDSQRALLEARITHIDEGLSSLPPYRADPMDATSTTWRGLHASDDLLAKLQLGSVFHDPGYLSTSLDARVAELFAMRAGEGTTPTVVTVHGHNGVDIAALSQYMDESEILFPRSSEFEVMSMEMGPGGIMRIALRQVGP
ncbi:ADP-ribosyltransferase [Mycobacterium kyogaense]|uniref:ADP-ribosyltransferase n=1 Tax=Mycobacterium kyogaense TaxID=2212479 RepID=UPI0013C3F57F|nr:ADP-ribosyltransferase [Mycobacterium kyogaense]